MRIDLQDLFNGSDASDGINDKIEVEALIDEYGRIISLTLQLKKTEEHIDSNLEEDTNE